jgi:hypothetical protein
MLLQKQTFAGSANGEASWQDGHRFTFLFSLPLTWKRAINSFGGITPRTLKSSVRDWLCCSTIDPAYPVLPLLVN